MDQQKDYLFQYLFRQFEPQVQGTLNRMYAHCKIQNEYNRRRELEQLKREIVNEVLNSLSLTTDVQEAVRKVKELDSAIDQLGK